MIVRHKLNNITFLTGTSDDLIKVIYSKIATKSSQIILPCSLFDFSQSNKNDYIKRCYASLDICTTDGMPIVWWFRIKFSQKIERVYGPELMQNLLQKTQSKNKGHVFFGSSIETISLLKKRINIIAPNLNALKFISPPFNQTAENLARKYTKTMQSLNPSIIWIGIGSPKQVVIASYWKKFLPHTTIICVGQAFDLISGKKSMAPHWMQKRGFEWLFRLIQEPKRLSLRYLVEIPVFLLKQLLVKVT